ncbi:hypothetical protein B6N58_14360 [Legionella micdadei]|nr:hypothetical protein B6N58_14360 [Legionella micdadei]
MGNLTFGVITYLWIQSLFPNIYFAAHAYFAHGLFLIRPSSWSRSILFPLLLSCAALSGYIFIPIIYILFGLFFAWDLFSKSYSDYRKQFTSLTLLISLTGYFVWEAKDWAGQSASLLGWPIHFGWQYYFLNEGILALGFLFFLFSLSLKKVNRASISYGLMFLVGQLFLIFTHDTDFSIKTTLFLHLLLILPATTGFIWCWNKLKKTAGLNWWLLGIPFGYFCCLNMVQIGYFCATSYSPRDLNEQFTLRKMQHLPFNEKILFIEPDAEKAAVSGHLIYMDFRPYRKDAYLPANERFIADNFFSSEKSRAKLEERKIKVIFTSNKLTEIRPYSNDLVTLPKTNFKQWQIWNSDPQNKISYQISELVISSKNHLVDSALVSPIHLSKGTYQISAKIAGYVKEGNGHISLLGAQKLIIIPPATYSRPTIFTNIFTVTEPDWEGLLGFGLGGWSVGKGSIQLQDLVIEQLA